MAYEVQTSLKGNNVRVTLVIAYLVKDTCETNYNYTHIDDFFPDLLCTHTLMQKIKSNETYQVMAIEYYCDDIDFKDYDSTVVNTIH